MEVLSVRKSIATDINNIYAEGSVGVVENGVKTGSKAMGVLAVAMKPVSVLADNENTSTSMDNFFKTIANNMEKIYNGMKGYVHIFAAVLLSIAILIRLFSRNPRSIEEANAWIKNIAISWIMFNMIGVMVGFLADFKDSQNYESPWKGAQTAK